MSENYLSGEELIWQGRPSWRSMWAFYIKWGVVAMLPLIISIIVAAKTDSNSYWKTTLLIGAVAMAFVLLIGAVKRLDARYRLTTERISVRSGILSRKVQRTQIRYIRGADFTQSPLERLLGIGDVEVATASSDTEDAVYVLHGVRDPDALVQAIDECKHRDQQQRHGLASAADED